MKIRCRHMVICNYFGEMSTKACETMCDVCTQRDLVAVNLQNLKVEIGFLLVNEEKTIKFALEKEIR